MNEDFDDSYDTISTTQHLKNKGNSPLIKH